MKNGKVRKIFDVFYELGLVHGCDCRNASEEAFPHGISNKKCTEFQTKMGCVDTPEVPSVNFTKFFDKDGLCLSHLNTSMAEGYSYTTSDGKCIKGYKICPSDLQATSKNYKNLGKALCISKDIEKCPISDLRLKKKEEKNPDEKCFKESLEIDSSEILYISRNCGKGPVVDFRLGEDGICRNLNMWREDHNQTPSPLLKIPPGDCALDENAKEVASKAQTEVFDLNSIQIPSAYRESILDYKFRLYKVGYTTYNPEFRNEEDFELFISGKKTLSHFFS